MTKRGPFYKATRVDGTDFHSGTVLYVKWKGVRPKKAEYRQICGPGYLHASDVPTETLIGGSWPCRLFEVTGKPDAGFDDNHPHKGGFKQLTVKRELPAHQVFGPQGEELVEFFEAVRGLDTEQVKKLRAAWGAARGAALAGVAKDLITPDQFRVLAGPWISVMGWPEATTDAVV